MVHELFEQALEARPEAIAVALEGEHLSYAELGRRARSLAERLTELGVRPEVLVGLATERSVEMIVGVLAVLEAGGGYVPLDTSYPRERLRFMIEDSGALVLLTQERVIERLPEVPGVGLLVLDRPAGPGQQVAAPPPRPGDPSQLAYLMYTSGSTGQPKGVAVTHGSVVNLARQAVELMEVGPGSRVLQLASFSFDASVLETLLALATGSRLQLVSKQTLLSGEGLAEAMARYAITTMAIPPSLLNTVPEGSFPALASIVVGGEACPAETANRWAPGRCFLNAYAPTEATIFVTTERCAGGHAEGPSLGEAIEGGAVHLLDADLQPVPVGKVGEIYLGGLCLARGYHRRRGLTAERFVPDPKATEPGGRLYKTGDLARWRLDGDGRRQLCFIGRADHQVKVRGLRIELGEIEQALRSHPAVREAVVLAWDDGEGGGNRRLVAYFFAEPSFEQPSARELRAFLAERLPGFMVPTAYVLLRKIPISLTGKVDKSQLPPPGEDRELLSSPYVAPATELEQELTSLWAELLGRSAVGVADNLFELGGHSLLVARIVARVRQELGVEVPLSFLFQQPTVGDLAAFVAARLEGEPIETLPPVERAPRDQPLPLTFPQERIWFLNQLSPRAIAYNFQFTLHFRGRLEPVHLAAALSEIVCRHEVLRTGFPALGGRPVQVIYPPWRVRLPVIDVSGLEEVDREAATRWFIHRAVRVSFDTSRPPLLAWRLLRRAADDHLLAQVEHHFVHDGWSLAVLMGELKALYGAFSCGLGSPLAPLAVQYADFAVWQRRWLDSGALDRQLAWWLERLADRPDPIDLPTDRPRPARLSHQGDVLRADLPRELYQDLRARSRAEGVSLFTVALSAFWLLLARYTGQTDLLLGSGVANRRLKQSEPLIGMVVNTLVLRTRLDADPTFSQLLARTRETLIDAQEHQDLPFETLVKALQPDRDLGRNPLFSVMFSFHDSPVPDFELPGLTAELFERHNGSAKMDLNVVVKPAGEMTMVWEFATDLFDRATIERMWGHYQVLLAAAVAEPGRRLHQLPLLSPAEAEQLARWNDTGAADLALPPVLARFAAAVARAPEAPAVVSPEGQLSYGALDAAANRLARRLLEAGVGPERIAAVLLPRSPSLVVAQLAVLKTGGAYLPLDPGSPPDRLAFMLQDSGAKVLITDAQRGDPLAALPTPQVVLDREAEDLAGRSGEPLALEPDPDGLAYAIYTSGSTGLPKAVAVRNGGLANLVQWHLDAYLLGPEDRGSLVSGLAFDASVWEIWSVLAAGASLVLPPEEVRAAPGPLLSWLQEERVTVAFLPTPLAEAMLDDLGREPARAEGLALRFLLVGGDTLHAPPPPGLPFELVNHYGPTESSVVATCCSLPAAGPGGAPSGPPPIGHPIDRLQAQVLDRFGDPAPVGVPGELVLAGAGLARGYLGRPGLTAESFLPSSSGAPGERLYRTGDLVRRRRDGELDFLGRIDTRSRCAASASSWGRSRRPCASFPGCATRWSRPSRTRRVANGSPPGWWAWEPTCRWPSWRPRWPAGSPR